MNSSRHDSIRVSFRNSVSSDAVLEPTPDEIPKNDADKDDLKNVFYP